MDFRAMQRLYEGLLQHQFLPFWFRFVDEEHGGILNCISNEGDSLLAGDKFTWSQGRWLWVLSKVYALKQQGLFPEVSAADLKRWMDATWDFLCAHSIYGDDVCCFVLERHGEKKADAATGRYDASIYADCFALIGMSAYVEALRCREKFPKAEALYASIRRRLESGDYLTEPYPVPEGYISHGIPMITLNTVHGYIHMKQALGLPAEDEIAYARRQLELILHRLYDGEGCIREFTPASGIRDDGLLLDRHLKPGHTLEDAWFWVEFLEEFGGLEEYLPQICKIVKTTFAAGWDPVYGGVFCFTDCLGGEPKGESRGTKYEQLVTDTWDMKLWWVHSELLYLFPKLYALTHDEDFRRAYEACFTYTFTTFPDHKTGEWTQIRKRDGAPQQKVVALPVKDPFHIIRNFIKLIDLSMEKVPMEAEI